MHYNHYYMYMSWSEKIWFKNVWKVNKSHKTKESLTKFQWDIAIYSEWKINSKIYTYMYV